MSDTDETAVDVAETTPEVENTEVAETPESV